MNAARTFESTAKELLGEFKRTGKFPLYFAVPTDEFLDLYGDASLRQFPPWADANCPFPNVLCMGVPVVPE